MTLTLGICDDSREQIELLLHYVGRYPGAEQFKIIQSTQPEDFLGMLEDGLSLLALLDVDMDGMNGIQLGEQIRARYEDAVILYITAHEEYALDAFRVRAFHYLIKPLTEEKFLGIFNEAVRAVQRNADNRKAKAILVQKKGELISVEYRDIIYFEKVGHKICLHGSDRNIDYYGNFSKLLAQIDRDSFLQCHQGYIVNIDKIRGFRDKTLFLEGNRQVPVSRSFVESTKEKLAQSLFARKDRP